MADVELPQLGESVTEGIVTAWLVEVGDEVTVDQPIAEISTDKVDTEIPSPVAGVVQELRAEVDDTIEVGQVIAVIGDGDAAPSDGDSDDGAESGESDADVAPDGDQGSDAEGSGTSDDDAPAEAPPPDTEQPAAAAPAGQKVAKAEGQDADVIVLGGGTGGYSVALRAAQLGLDVILIEKEKVGGTCLHWGCIPTKAILQTAEVAEYAQDAADFGVSLDYHGIEVAALNAHKDGVVDKMWKGLQGALKGRGVETIIGTGQLTDANTIEVETDDGSRTVTGAAIVVATGSKPRELPFAPFDGDKILSSDHAMYLDELPSSAVILGSGAVGMEFASAWAAFGVEVTLVELEDRLLPLEDADASKEIGRSYRKKGITAMTGVKMSDVDVTDDGVTCKIEVKDDIEEVSADVLLVAVGRGPVTEGAGLDAAGVEVDDRGFVAVDGYCRTNVDNIWALGDVIPTLGLAHASFQEGFLVADQLGGLDVLPIDYRGVPRVVYCHPEVASVGYTEAEAKDEGFEVVTEKYPFQALGRAAMMKATGFVKIIAEKDTAQEGDAGRVLGIHIVGPKATDLIAEGQLIYNWEALPTDVAAFVHAHPSLSEAIGEAHLAIAGRALHG